MMLTIRIENGKKYYYPVVQGDVKWTTERKGSAGKLTFEVIPDSDLKITEGNSVSVVEDKDKIFYGFIFSIEETENRILKITAYDQLRYFKNKITYKYSMTASKLLKGIAKDYGLKTGSIADTKYKIKSRVEDNQTLFDIMQTALDMTLTNAKKLYVLFDNYGSLSLKAMEDLKVYIVVDAGNSQKYTYKSSIDDNTYNQIKLVYENKETGKLDTYITRSSKNINAWGLLQYYEKLKDGENGKEKADNLLKLYNQKTKSLQIKNVLGDNRVHAGCMVVVAIDLYDVKIQHWMLVESCTHTYSNGEHWMDLKLKGGVINNG